MTVGGYQILQEQAKGGLPKPSRDGFITHNAGSTTDPRRDRTCGSVTALDSRTVFGNLPERFYAAGEERAEMDLPEGYGYRSKGADNWIMSYS